MSDKTGIEWTDATWNPVRGCSRVSPGCEHCYAERIATRFSGPGQPYEGLVTVRSRHPQTGRATTGVRGKWNGVMRFVPEALAWPLKKKKPLRIFVNSMSDLFHEGLSDEEIAAVFGVMAACPQHTFQILTKRADRMRRWFEWLREVCATDGARPQDVIHYYARQARRDEPALDAGFSRSVMWPLPNVWLGASVEDQPRADERIPDLLATPAVVRFVSAEPLLSSIDLRRYLGDARRARVPRDGCAGLVRGATGRDDLATLSVDAGRNTDADTHQELEAPRLNWVIVGGESGPGARPFDVAWARSTVRQCRAAGVPVFVKQLGSHVITRNDDGLSGCDEGDWPNLDLDQVEHDLDGHVDGYQGAPVRVHLRDRKGGGDMSEWPEDLRVREFPGNSNAHRPGMVKALRELIARLESE